MPIEPRSPPVQLRSTEMISASVSRRPCTSTCSSSSVTSTGDVDAGRRTISTDRMMSSNSSATVASTRHLTGASGGMVLLDPRKEPTLEFRRPTQPGALRPHDEGGADVSPHPEMRGNEVIRASAIRSKSAWYGASAVGVRNGSSASWNAACSAPSKPSGTCRNRDTALEKPTSSSAVHRTRSCRSSTHWPPAGDPTQPTLSETGQKLQDSEGQTGDL